MPAYLLPTRLDTAAAAPLAADLLARLDAGEPLALDAAGVDVAGHACLQVLAGAERAARTRGVPFALVQPSDGLAAACTLAGLGRLLPAA